VRSPLGIARPYLTGTVEAPRNEIKKIKGLKIHALKPGEKL